MYTKWRAIMGLLLIAGVILSACQPAPEAVVETVVITQVVEGETIELVVTATPEPLAPEPVTRYAYSTTDIPTLDPQVGEDVVSINYIENIFVQLTNYDLVTSEIVPEAATSWDISANGLQYTFTLRTDIPWVKHNPVTGETRQEENEDGELRFVTAYDFEYGIKRACNPNTASSYSAIVAPLIKGCEAVLFAEDPDNIAPELVDAIGVSAVDEATLLIELEFPASYFLSMTPMWTLAAVPQWAIEEFEDNWVEAGNIVTNGRYVLSEWVHGVRRQIVRNPLMPADMHGVGNIDRLITHVVPDTSTGYALWLNNEVESSGIPNTELQGHLDQFPDETDQVPDLVVFHISFRMTKPPFDDAQVRRAFSAAFDRELFVETVIQGQGLPMTHFAPPGIFGAPPINEVGIGFDPAFAAAQLAEAGYPNCEGFPQVTLLGYSGQTTLNWIEFAQAQWEEHLGCSSDLIQIEQQPFRELLAATKAEVPDEDSPHMWTLAWGPDYADENNWVGDVLWCENPGLREKRSCTEIDDMIVEAREEPDPAKRIELYRAIEEGLFGPEGEVPFFPIWLRIAFVARHSWYDHIEALFGGQQWFNDSIDQSTQFAARGE
jgi:oligopeptide transport system substrate-binding protein